MDFAIDVARVLAGAFFAISGAHKIFNSERHKALVDTLKSTGLPGVPFLEWWVPGWEFVGGLLLVLSWPPGVVLGASALFVICTVALCTDGYQRVKSYEPVDWFDWLDDVLYLPETLYIEVMVIVGVSAVLELWGG